MKEFDDTKLSTIDADEEYAERLSRHIIDLLKRQAMLVDEVLSHSDGAFPTDVQLVISSLLTSGAIVREKGFLSVPNIGRMGKESGQRVSSERPNQDDKGSPQTMKSLEALADPHPADYDWRFVAGTVDEIADLLAPNIEDSQIALFGVPTLFCRLARKNVTLFDRSKSLIEDLRHLGFSQGLAQHDLFNPIDKAPTFDIIVADPPWYIEFYKAFLLRSAQALRRDGFLYLSVLPWLTRPTAIDDRFDIVHFANRCGFDIVRASPNVLRYQSPKFEQIGLKRKGISCEQWRRGDLFLFRRVEEPEKNLVISPPLDEVVWDEFRFGKKKIKVKKTVEGQDGLFTIAPVSENGKIFDSVSRRSGMRSRIDVWTSDNTAYSSTRGDILRDALKRISLGIAVVEVVTDLENRGMLKIEDKQRTLDILQELCADSSVEENQ